MAKKKVKATKKKRVTKKKKFEPKQITVEAAQLLSTKTKRAQRPLTKDQMVQLRELKEKIEPTLREMVRSDHFMLALWWIAGVRVPMRRISKNFPTQDFDNAVDTLDENLREERAKVNQFEYEDQEDDADGSDYDGD